MTLHQLHQRRAELVAWLNSCVAAEDWHGVRDAAAHLEVCEARIEEREGDFEPNADTFEVGGSVAEVRGWAEHFDQSVVSSCR